MIYHPIPFSAAPPSLCARILVEIDGRPQWVTYCGWDAQGGVVLLFRQAVLHVPSSTEWGRAVCAPTA